MTNFAGVLFDGIAYGSLLFLISIGLSVTLGLMNFINLAHGAFAMFGGYLCVTLMSRLGVPFLVTLPLTFMALALAGWSIERTLVHRLYRASPLDQVLFSIGLTFISVAVVTYIWGTGQLPVNLPSYLGGQWKIAGVNVSVYRLFLIALVAIITLTLVLLLVRTRYGAMIRAAVDNAQAAGGLGINVAAVFSATFALGTGLAGLGGALSVDILSLNPNYALNYTIYFLFVVTVGGAGSIAGTLIAAMLLGVVTIAGNYYVPEIGGFVTYVLMIVLLLVFPGGLNRRSILHGDTPQAASFGGGPVPARFRATASTDPRLPDARWRPAEIAFWVVLAGIPFVTPGYNVLVTQILITGLFALSLDLIMGYAGIVSLGHAALFGCGAYAAGILARMGWGEPFSGLVAGGLIAGVVGYLSSFIIRGSDIARLMVTLGICLMLSEAANRAVSITGGADGLGDIDIWRVLGLFAFDLRGFTAYYYALAIVFAMFFLARRLVASPFGLGLRGIRESHRRMPAIGAPVRRRLATVYTISAVVAGIAGALLTETTQFVGIDVVSFGRSSDILMMLVVGGVGWLYGGIMGAALFLVSREILADMNPTYWQFWLGLLLILLVFFARGGLHGILLAAYRGPRARSA
ncbi:MAG TPA: ABC transporter permease [Stellaceae bacterium]